MSHHSPHLLLAGTTTAISHESPLTAPAPRRYTSYCAALDTPLISFSATPPLPLLHPSHLHLFSIQNAQLPARCIITVDISIKCPHLFISYGSVHTLRIISSPFDSLVASFNQKSSHRLTASHSQTIIILLAHNKKIITRPISP